MFNILHNRMPDKPLGRKGVQVIEVVVGACVIHSVVVYSDRAEVRRTVPASLAAGENEVLLTGLAECVDKNSIRYTGGRGMHLHKCSSRALM